MAHFFKKKSYDRSAFITLATACNHTQTQRTDIQTRIRSLPCLFNSPFNVMLSLFLYSITHTLLLDALSSLSLFPLSLAVFARNMPKNISSLLKGVAAADVVVASHE